MNKQKWLIVGLSLAMAASLGVGISACGGEKDPDTPPTPTEHTHTYDAWDYDETQHWKYCDEHGTDKSNIDESTRAPHQVNSVMHTCECGYVEPHTHNYTYWSYDDEDHFKRCVCGEIDETTRAPHTVDPKTHECTLDGCNYRRHPDADLQWHMTGVQHWQQCSTCKWILEETRGKHKFVDGTCEVCGGLESELLKKEMYVYGLGKEAFGYTGKWPTTNQISNDKDKWVKMELGDDGKYTADIYLTPNDMFAVGDATTNTRYPAVENVNSVEGALQVETANTYTVTFDPADGSVTFAVHAHTYDVWKYDADNHWKVCSTKDQTVDESSRAPHSYDPETHECECGAVETVSCEHSNGYVFDYEELPAAEADGGTLQKTCPDCGDTQDVTYSKGFTGDTASTTIPGTIGDISEEGTYYFTTGNKYQTLGLKITEAGTYTLTFEEVFDSNSEDGRLVISALAFSTNNYATMLSVPFAAIAVGAVSPAKKADLTTYAVQVNGVTPTNESLKRDDIVTLSFTVTEEQLQAGDLCVSIHLRGGLPPLTAASVPRDAVENSLSHLVTMTKSAAEANVAPAEVAMLPEKKD